MAIVRFEPFRELISLQDRMNRLFNESYRSQGSEDDWALGGTWAPAVDIYEHENNIVIKAEFKDGVLRVTLPKREEAKPKQIQISVAK